LEDRAVVEAIVLGAAAAVGVVVAGIVLRTVLGRGEDYYD